MKSKCKVGILHHMLTKIGESSGRVERLDGLLADTVLKHRITIKLQYLKMRRLYKVIVAISKCLEWMERK
jgi:hypothetical protein